MPKLKLDWGGWTYGLFKVMISGGAGSVVSALGATVIDNKDFAMGSANFFHMMYLTFLLHLAINGFMYLQKTPLPEPIEVETTVQTFRKTPGGPDVITTVKQTATVPLEEAPIPPQPSTGAQAVQKEKP